MFRHPTLVARMAAAIDQLSSGRLVLGLGAGWNVPEHQAFGLPFSPVRERMDVLEESIQVIRALEAPGKANFAGRYYRLGNAEMNPKPVQRALPILAGGSGERRTRGSWPPTPMGGTCSAPSWSGCARRARFGTILRAGGARSLAHRLLVMAAFVIGENAAAITRRLTVLRELLPTLPAEDDTSLLCTLRGRGWPVGWPRRWWTRSAHWRAKAYAGSCSSTTIRRMSRYWTLSPARCCPQSQICRHFIYHGWTRAKRVSSARRWRSPPVRADPRVLAARGNGGRAAPAAVAPGRVRDRRRQQSDKGENGPVPAGRTSSRIQAPVSDGGSASARSSATRHRPSQHRERVWRRQWEAVKFVGAAGPLQWSCYTGGRFGWRRVRE